MFRGILSTIYLEPRGKNNAKTIYKLLKKYHKNNFFVKIAKYNTPIGTGEVSNTNYCKISVCENRKKNKIIIISAIDNLIKGGSGQAVQNIGSEGITDIATQAGITPNQLSFLSAPATADFSAITMPTGRITETVKFCYILAV